MPPLTHHLFVCCNQRAPGHTRGCCDPEGSEQLRSKLKAEIERRGIGASVQAARSGCLNQCELGPTVVIYPQGVWYGRVHPSDARRIVEETVIGGRVIEELEIPGELLNTRAGWVANHTGPTDPGGESPS